MELPYITEPLSTPDIFWASGDGVFQKLLPSTYRKLSQHEQTMFRMTDIRGNLNFHLLTHQRLVIPDTSLLLSPTLMTLFNEKPAYSDFLSQGIIVPVMREGVTSFQDLVKVLRKGKNWVDPPDHNVDKWAMFLDNVRPTIAVTPTSLNRGLMDSIGDEKLLRAEFWEAIGLGKARNELVKYVPLAMKKNQQKHIRQTEFWEYAAKLDKRRTYLQANMIRTRLSVISMGVMAKTLGMPLSYPSAYSNQLDEIYGTNSPYHCNKDLVIIDKPALEEEIENIRQHFFSGVYYLSPGDIWDVRESDAYKTLMKELVRYDKSDADTTNNDLFSAWRGYLQNYSITVGLRYADTLEEWSNLKMIIRWLVPGGIVASQTVGILCSYVFGQPLCPAVLGTATTIATIYLTREIEKNKKELERRAQIKFLTKIPQLQREDGQLVSELYGPIEKNYWQM